jgi:hypothetical protein
MLQRTAVHVGWMHAAGRSPSLRTAVASAATPGSCVARQPSALDRAVRGMCGGGGVRAGASRHVGAGGAGGSLPADNAAAARTAGVAVGRTHRCGELRASDEDVEVTLCGWVQRSRVFSDKLAFVTLRDATGVVQVRPSIWRAHQVALGQRLDRAECSLVLTCVHACAFDLGHAWPRSLAADRSVCVCVCAVCQINRFPFGHTILFCVLDFSACSTSQFVACATSGTMP